MTSGFGWLGDLLAAPVARWDAAWYLVIAHYGYRPDLASFGAASRAAFFPLYPLGVRAISKLGVPPMPPAWRSRWWRWRRRCTASTA